METLLEKKPRNGGTNGILRHAKREKMSSHLSLESVDRAEVFDLIPTVIVVMDTNHTILDLNETAVRTAGKRKKDCIGAKFWDLFDNPGCRAGTCAASDAVRTGKVCEGEALPTIQGKEMPVQVSAAPRFDKRGRVVGVVEIVMSTAADVEGLTLVGGQRRTQADGAQRLHPEHGNQVQRSLWRAGGIGESGSYTNSACD